MITEKQSLRTLNPHCETSLYSKNKIRINNIAIKNIKLENIKKLNYSSRHLNCHCEMLLSSNNKIKINNFAIKEINSENTKELIFLVMKEEIVLNERIYLIHLKKKQPKYKLTMM